MNTVYNEASWLRDRRYTESLHGVPQFILYAELLNMASKKKEEQNLKTLRELISQPHNKQCLECHQKGPTYVDMTTCGFICTQCSGYLWVLLVCWVGIQPCVGKNPLWVTGALLCFLYSRGINPPHRVKSVSMTTFSEAELDKLRNGGNEVRAFHWVRSDRADGCCPTLIPYPC